MDNPRHSRCWVGISGLFSGHAWMGNEMTRESVLHLIEECPKCGVRFIPDSEICQCQDDPVIDDAALQAAWHERMVEADG